MNEEGFRKALAFVATNADKLSWIISYFRPKDLEQGRLIIPKELFQNELRNMVLEKLRPYVTNITLDFSCGAIHLTADAQIDILGPVTVRYMLQVEDFVFNAEKKRVMFRYYEDLKSRGNYMQQAAIKTASLKGSYTKTLLSMKPVPGILADNVTISIDLSRLPMVEKAPPQLRLGYLAAEDGVLKMNFRWEEKDSETTTSQGEKDSQKTTEQSTPKPEKKDENAAGQRKVQGGYLKGLMNYSDRF